MEANNDNNLVSEKKESKAYKIFAWISLVIATLLIAYIYYFVIYKGFQYVDTLFKDSTETVPDSHTMVAIIVVIALQPLAKFGISSILYFMITLYGLVLSIAAIISIKFSLKIISSKSTANIKVEGLIVSTIIMVFIFVILLI